MEKLCQTDIFVNAKGKDEFEIECCFCNGKMSKTKRQILRNFKKGQNTYCKQECQNQYKIQKNNAIVSCLQCDSFFSKRVSQIRKSPNHFCTKSCAASYNNKFKKKSKFCKYCTLEIISGNYRRTVCDTCLSGVDMTLGDCTITHLHRSSAYAKVRTRARKVTKDRIQKCENCEYSKHVQVGHIKPISEFSLGTLVSIVNAPLNLALFCPNCHWEFDHDL